MENQKLPNATAVLVLGILSILTCICYGGGLIFGIIALILAAKDLKAYRLAPENYDNYQNLNIGRILSIIGLVLSVIMIILMIWVVSIVGMDALGNEDLARERMQDYFGQ
jgi:hypothetical protein